LASQTVLRRYVLDYNDSQRRVSRPNEVITSPLEDRTARLTTLVDPRKKALFERLCARGGLTFRRSCRERIHTIDIHCAGAANACTKPCADMSGDVYTPSSSGRTGCTLPDDRSLLIRFCLESFPIGWRGRVRLEPGVTAAYCA
jgi:hypothetical protein